MRLKEKNNFKKFFKKYMIWIVLVVAILIIPATNAKYILQKSASFELKPDQYNLVVTPVTTTVTSATSDINFKVKNNNQYPINVDIVYNGNVVATGITIQLKMIIVVNLIFHKMFMMKSLITMELIWILGL